MYFHPFKEAARDVAKNYPCLDFRSFFSMDCFDLSGVAQAYGVRVPERRLLLRRHGPGAPCPWYEEWHSFGLTLLEEGSRPGAFLAGLEFVLDGDAMYVLQVKGAPIGRKFYKVLGESDWPDMLLHHAEDWAFEGGMQFSVLTDPRRSRWWDVRSEKQQYGWDKRVLGLADRNGYATFEAGDFRDWVRRLNPPSSPSVLARLRADARFSLLDLPALRRTSNSLYL